MQLLHHLRAKPSMLDFQPLCNRKPFPHFVLRWIIKLDWNKVANMRWEHLNWREILKYIWLYSPYLYANSVQSRQEANCCPSLCFLITFFLLFVFRLHANTSTTTLRDAPEQKQSTSHPTNWRFLHRNMQSICCTSMPEKGYTISCLAW